MPQFSTSYGPATIETRTSAPPTMPSPAAPGMDPNLADIARRIMEQKFAAQEARNKAEQARYADEQFAREESARSRYVDPSGSKLPAYRDVPQPVFHGGGASAVVGGGGTRGSSGNMQQQMQALALRDARLQIQAKETPAPQRYITGPNIIPGAVDAPELMNGYQRQAYVPQSSQGRF